MDWQESEPGTLALRYRTNKVLPAGIIVALALLPATQIAEGRRTVTSAKLASTGCVMNNSCPTPGSSSPTSRGMRYCRRPGLSGAYLSASPDVSCTTARKVERKVFAQPCVRHNACGAYGFLCLAYWEGRYDRPFTYTHHAICRSPRGRRIEADQG
jgi:hypothetical protein